MWCRAIAEGCCRRGSDRIWRGNRGGSDDVGRLLQLGIQQLELRVAWNRSGVPRWRVLRKYGVARRVLQRRIPQQLRITTTTITTTIRVTTTTTIPVTTQQRQHLQQERQRQHGQREQAERAELWRGSLRQFVVGESRSGSGGSSNAFSGMSGHSVGSGGGWSSRAESSRGWGSMRSSGFGGGRFGGGGGDLVAAGLVAEVVVDASK